MSGNCCAGVPVERSCKIATFGMERDFSTYRSGPRPGSRATECPPSLPNRYDRALERRIHTDQPIACNSRRAYAENTEESVVSTCAACGQVPILGSSGSNRRNIQAARWVSGDELDIQTSRNLSRPGHRRGNRWLSRLPDFQAAASPVQATTGWAASRRSNRGESARPARPAGLVSARGKCPSNSIPGIGRPRANPSR